MDYFESIIKKLLEEEGYWVRQSYKVNLTKEEKRIVGKPTIPRPEIDLLAFKPGEQTILLMEAKSYLDSAGVRYEPLTIETEIPEGGYKILTCPNYKDVLLSRIRKDLEKQGLISGDVNFTLGLAAGKVYKSKSSEISEYFESKGWLFWSPNEIKTKVAKLAYSGYENDPIIITAKLLLR